MSEAERDATMNEAFEDPKSAKNNQGEFSSHSLPDMIEMDNHLASQDAGKKGGKKSQFNGIKMQRVGFPRPV